jgi:protease I
MVNIPKNIFFLRGTIMENLADLRVAVLATNGYEEAELLEPVRALQSAGALVTIVALEPGEIQGFRHDKKAGTVKVDRLIKEVTASEFDALELPGGALNADALRMVPELQLFLQDMDKAGKPIAFICHAAWELISADLVRARRLTSYFTIQDDIRNAGGIWLNQEVVEDNNWVSSRQPQDIPAFNKAMIELFSHSLVAGNR